MAYRLLGASSGQIAYPNPFGVLTQLSIAATVRVVNDPTASPERRIVSKWNATTLLFALYVVDTNEIGFLIQNGGSFYGRKTTTVNLGAGQTYGIVATVLCGSPPVMRIWVNGVQTLLSAHVAASNVTQIGAAASSILVGYDSANSVAGLDADYEQVGLWPQVIPPLTASRISAGLITPLDARAGSLVVGAPLDNRGAWNVAGGTVGTLTAATKVANVLKQRRRRLLVDAVAAPPPGSGRIFVLASNGGGLAGPSRGLAA